ncbi:hypothetical protein EDEG_01103 [Edhazardia aedis USNM 41457]|uniref:Uncharacterized protein n=1 Tax=Edhazardia aedis (strain USNM 41457) TaxID=1003232 RepID=J9DQ63_EDHAE|nr:hypothetical protein EDEG_01103 [Edhazardia aedis USNM 41457]|eukprot:EJW04690.1 hypothetical protein EDEG_01103 [Edhazardia aedis USNM 41457]
MKLVEHKLQNESNKKEDFSTNTSSYEANEICTISSKTYVSDCSSVNSNNSLYINIDKNQFDNDNSVNLKNQLFTTSNQNTSSLDTFSNTISCKNYNSEESLSDGKLFKAENNDSADLVVDNESSFSNLSLEESEKLDLHDHLERETNTFYRKKLMIIWLTI